MYLELLCAGAKAGIESLFESNKNNMWLTGLLLEISKSWSRSSHHSATDRKDTLCIDVIKICLETDNGNKVHEWMSSCIQKGKGVCFSFPKLNCAVRNIISKVNVKYCMLHVVDQF